MVLIDDSDERVQALRVGYEAHRQTHIDLVPCANPDCMLATPEGVEKAVAIFIEYLQRMQAQAEE
jgi:hypothetical protein